MRLLRTFDGKDVIFFVAMLNLALRVFLSTVCRLHSLEPYRETLAESLERVTRRKSLVS